MRVRIMKRLVVPFAVLVLVACGGEGGGGTGDGEQGAAADTMTVTVVRQSTGTTTTTYTANGTDTTTWGGVYESTPLTSIIMNSPTVQVAVSANGATTGTYPITGDLAVLSVRYTLYTSPTLTEIYATNGSGTIVITGIGAVGGQITGTFNADVYKSYPVSDPTSTLTVSGKFSVRRYL